MTQSGARRRTPPQHSPDESSVSLLEGVSDAVNTVEEKAVESFLWAWHELPEWMQDNAYITGGYRKELKSFVACGKSIFHIHNESVNIWTHLLGALGALGVMFGIYYYLLSTSAGTTWVECAMFYIFILSAFSCLAFSATFHTVVAHSHQVACAYNRLDYIGIAILIVGSFYPALYYGFYLHPYLAAFYLMMITIFGACTVYVVIAPHYRTPDYRWMRTIMFLLLGFCAIFPVGHFVILDGIFDPLVMISVPYLLLMGALYVTGAVMYASRVPERWIPGKVNILGSSHQIFHVFVVLAALSHLVGVIKSFNYWHSPEGRLRCSTYA